MRDWFLVVTPVVVVLSFVLYPNEWVVLIDSLTKLLR